MGDLRRRGPLGHKGQHEVVDDSIHHSMVGEGGDDLYVAAASRTEHRVEEGGHAPNSREFGTCPLFFSDGPALGRHGSELTWAI